MIVKGRMTSKLLLLGPVEFLDRQLTSQRAAPASTTARTCAGSFDARELGIESGSAGQGGQFGFFACIDSAGTSGTFFVAGGGGGPRFSSRESELTYRTLTGGAGYAGPDGDLPASNGADAEPVLSDVCSAQRGLTSGSRPFERAGGPGGGCAPAALIGSDGAGGGGGFSGVLAAGTAPSYAIGSPTVFSAPSRSDGSVRFFLECVSSFLRCDLPIPKNVADLLRFRQAPYVEPTTTVLETVPATTTIFESGKIIETFTTPATRVVSNQAPAPTVTVDEIISLVTTPATSTRTSTLTSTTGSTKCVQLRLVSALCFNFGASAMKSSSSMVNFSLFDLSDLTSSTFTELPRLLLSQHLPRHGSRSSHARPSFGHVHRDRGSYRYNHHSGRDCHKGSLHSRYHCDCQSSRPFRRSPRRRRRG